MDRKRFALALVALAAGLAVAWLMLTNDVRRPPGTEVVLTLGVGWSFVASGLVAWQLRPGNVIGPVMILAGFLQLGAGLGWSQSRFLFTIGHLVHLGIFAAVTFILLAFPSGRLGTTLNRAVFGAALVIVGPLNVAWLVLGGPPFHGGSCDGCPGVVLAVTSARSVVTAIEWTQEIGGAVIAATAIAVLMRRWHGASARLRFAIAPVLWVGAAALAALLLWLLYLVYAVSLSLGDPLGEAAWILVNLVVASVAIAFLVGVARTRLARSAVADLVVKMGEAAAPTALRDSLARTLHDPSLEVAYWLEDAHRYADARGRPVELVDGDKTRAVTMIEREGRRIAALVHDPALREDEHLVRSVCAAAALELDNERLQAELRAQLDEVEASRARIVEAAQAERRRIERDLHDGAQQRLVSVAMSLGLVESKVATEPEAALGFVREAKGRLSDALVELRDLSQGIHPGILTERGLPAALAELVQRTNIQVMLDVSLSERLPERVEEAAYYVVSEALTNVIKHAHATHARVQVDRVDGVAVMRVSDDGTGGADATRGSGLRGLRDRVEALGGQLTIASHHGRGTVLEARLPCAS